MSYTKSYLKTLLNFTLYFGLFFLLIRTLLADDIMGYYFLFLSGVTSLVGPIALYINNYNKKVQNERKAS
jgi:hypothetical protein